MHGWTYAYFHSFTHVFEAKRFAEELSEEESSKQIRNEVPKST